jgi:hypothetical protein
VDGEPSAKHPWRTVHDAPAIMDSTTLRGTIDGARVVAPTLGPL